MAGEGVNPQNEAKVALLLLSPIRIPEAAVDNLGVRGIHLLIGDHLSLVVRCDAVIKDVLLTGLIELPWFRLHVSQFRVKPYLIVGQIGRGFSIVRDIYAEAFPATFVLDIAAARQIGALHSSKRFGGSSRSGQRFRAGLSRGLAFLFRGNGEAAGGP